MNACLVAGASVLILCLASAASADWIDLTHEWRFMPDEDGQGESSEWQDPACPDADWAVIEAGVRWEDQGYAELEAIGWYRRSVTIPAAWQGKPVWLVLGAVNDACIAYCNGERIGAYGDLAECYPETKPRSRRTRSLYRTPVLIPLKEFARFGEENSLALQIIDWGGSGGIVSLPCGVTNDPARLPTHLLLAANRDYARQKVVVNVDLAGLGTDWPEAVLRTRLTRVTDGSLVEERAFPLAPACAADVAFDVPDAEAGGAYLVEAMAEGLDGNPIADVIAAESLTWPAWPEWRGDYASLRVLNTFVTELLSVAVEEKSEHTFLNPRKGWVFFSVTGVDAEPALILDDEPDPLVWRENPDTGAFEAMRELDEGRHTARIAAGAPAQLDVRAVPMIAYCYHPASPHMTPYGTYDWAYLERYALSHVNTIVTREAPMPEKETWLREGRKWVGNAGLPGLNQPRAVPANDVYRSWAGNVAVTDPDYAGLFVDEFLDSSPAHFKEWGDAVRMLDDAPGFAGKTFYAWCGDLFVQPQGLEFSRLLMDLGHRFAWEKYLNESPTEEEARMDFLNRLQRPLELWQRDVPDVAQHMVMCYGYLCAPPESSNLNPAVDYQVFLDMQFHYLANEPAFWRMYGIMEYTVSYADEESLRYAHKLFRHYCIEGNRNRFSNDPYVLPHLKNPDFAEGLAHWRIDAAEEGSIAQGEMLGFNWLAARFQQANEPDPFCKMRRSRKGPNRIRQTIRKLEPGRLYSLKLISADVGNLHEKQELALRIGLDEVERVEKYCFQFPYPSCYSHEVGPYTRENPAHFNFHRIVFRPKATTARLTISDWVSDNEAGGPAGQEIAFNFVEVQPFHEP